MPTRCCDCRIPSGSGVMADERGQVRSIAWHELLPWTSVLPRGFKLAVSSRVLLLAALGLVALAAGNHLIGYVLSGNEQVNRWYQQDRWPWELRDLKIAQSQQLARELK